MSAANDEFEAAGSEVVAAFMCGAGASEAFCESRGVPFDCVGDPTRAGFAEVGLGRGERRQLLGLQVARRHVSAIREGATVGAGASGGDMAQLPGVFVVGTDGRLADAHYGRHPADNPPVQDVLSAVLALTGVAGRSASHGPSRSGG